MKSLEKNPVDRPVSAIQEIQEDNLTRFIYEENGERVGSVCATLIENKKYDISGLFVDPTKRGQGIASSLIKNVNAFLQRENAVGILINMASGDAANVYESNGWRKGEYKSDGEHGGCEFTYDAREKNIDLYPKLGYCYKGFIFNNDKKLKRMLSIGAQKTVPWLFLTEKMNTLLNFITMKMMKLSSKSKI